MRVYTHALGRINYVEDESDLPELWDFLRRAPSVLGIDTETTGLRIYAPGFAVRLLQLGSRDESYVLRADRFADTIRELLSRPRHWVAHNAVFDLLALDRVGLADFDTLAPQVFDTYLLAHLLDPRTKRDGGIGLGLKELSSVYVDDDAPDTEKELYAIFRKDYKANKETGWSVIDIDHPAYVTYAGLDTILVTRLFDELAPMVREAGLNHLSMFEHALAIVVARMERRGVAVDVPYTERLAEELTEEAERYKAVAVRYGVDNINSTEKVAAALVGMDEELTERTASGKLKVDKAVLQALADLTPDWTRAGAREPNELAAAVLHAKRAEKWRESYALSFLDYRDARGRIHPHIRTLQARTARMSVSEPPLQQLPSQEWRIRRAIVADPGNIMAAADYAQVEMRVLAALSGEERMLSAIRAGVDIHDNTATAMYGSGFSKHQRKIAKNTGFGEVFGGGAVTLARQAGVSVDVAREAKALFAEGFPGIKRYGKKLQQRAEWGRKEVITPSGRHLPLDRDRLYAATNYMVQSTARDVLAEAIMRLDEKGLTEHVVMPIHDEVLIQAPAADVEELIREVSRTMEMDDFYGVPIESDYEVYGPSWGHGYGAKD